MPTFDYSLQEANAELQLALALANVAMWRHDLVRNRLHYNARSAEILGLAIQPEGLPLVELNRHVHPNDLSEVIAWLKRTRHSRHPQDLQFRYFKNGHWRYLLTRCIAQRNANEEPIALTGVALDITEQIERTQCNDELARELDEVTAVSGIGVWRIRRDGQGAEWNRQLFTLFGIPFEPPPPPFDQWIDRFVHPDDRERLRAHGRQWFNNPQDSTEIAYRIVRPNGQLIHVVARGRVEPAHSPYRLTGVTIDVTEREQALAALREATERSALATRAAGIGIWEWYPANDAMRWDEQMYLLRGLKPRPTCPSISEIMALIHEEDRERINAEVHQTHQENGNAYYEYRIVRPDGEIRWLASRAMSMRDDKGQLRSKLGVNWDITQAREAAAARQERALALRESRAKSELLARMSHELRTPMNAVLGFTQLLLAEDTDPTNSLRRQRLQHIQAAGEHLLTLINDVLDLSRLDNSAHPMPQQKVRLDTLIEQTLPLVEQLAEQHGIRLDIAVPALSVQADPTALKQVLVNLLSNAIKYNRRDGTVRIEASLDSHQVVLRVIDNGIGMSSEQQTLAFEPFARAGAQHEGIEGTGLGLTIVKTLVERMGGTIEMQSTLGVGSVCSMRLDASSTVCADVPVPRKILYIEDNEVNVLIVCELVRRHESIELESAGDGLSGVAQAIRNPPAFVLVDMQLPDISGLEVLARLRAEPATAHLLIIALSANAMPEDIEYALQAGFDEYWTKPLDFKVFNQTLDRVFGARNGGER